MAADPLPATLLFATANSAHNELPWDRTELRQLTHQLEHANVNAPDHDEKLNKVLDLMTHMDYTAGLHGHANERIGEILAEEQRQAEYEGSLRQRIGQFFESFRNRFFGGDDNSQNPGGADPAGGATTTLIYTPPRSGPALDYPNADAFDENSSLTELTALAFDRVHNPAVDENMQALWEMMKSPRGDGDFWQAAAYGAANRDLLDPKDLGVDQYMNYRPGLDPDTKEAAERSEELLALAYRRNAELLYNEPHNVWQPGDRSEGGLLSFNRVHRALYASEGHMRAYNEHVAAESNGPYWAADPEERRTLLHDLTGGPENPEGISAYATAKTEQTASP